MSVLAVPKSIPRFWVGLLLKNPNQLEKKLTGYRFLSIQTNRFSSKPKEKPKKLEI
jgi:hypothetical protein